MKTTIIQIDEALKNLGDAMKVFIKLNQLDTEIKIKKQKAHNDLLIAKEAVRSLQVNY